MGRPKAQYNTKGQKRCSVCKQYKYPSQFTKTKRSWDGLEPRCQACRQSYHAKHYGQDRMENLRLRNYDAKGNKLCTHCTTFKPLTEFTRDKQAWDGYRRECILCASQIRILRFRKRGVRSHFERRSLYDASGKKLCRKCSNWQASDNFYSDNKWDGLGTVCKGCQTVGHHLRWMVYCMELSIAGQSYYKIGISKHPDIRLKQVQTGSPEPVKIVLRKLIGDEKNARRLEMKIHQQLKPFRRNGEWFLVGLSTINELITKQCNSKTVIQCK